MLLRLVFILAVLIPSFAVAHIDDEPRGLSCYERLGNLIAGKKVTASELKVESVQWVSTPYDASAFKALVEGFGFRGAAQIIFTQYLRDGVWIVESPTGKEDQIAVRSVADNRPHFSPIYSSIKFKTQNDALDASFYNYAGITSYVEMLDIRNITPEGFTMHSEHHYLPGGSTSLKFKFAKDGWLESLDFGVTLVSGTVNIVYKVKGYLNFPNSRAITDIRRTE